MSFLYFHHVSGVWRVSSYRSVWPAETFTQNYNKVWFAFAIHHFNSQAWKHQVRRTDSNHVKKTAKMQKNNLKFFNGLSRLLNFKTHYFWTWFKNILLNFFCFPISDSFLILINSRKTNLLSKSAKNSFLELHSWSIISDIGSNDFLVEW